MTPPLDSLLNLARKNIIDNLNILSIEEFAILPYELKEKILNIMPSDKLFPFWKAHFHHDPELLSIGFKLLTCVEKTEASIRKKTLQLLSPSVFSKLNENDRSDVFNTLLACFDDTNESVEITLLNAYAKMFPHADKSLREKKLPYIFSCLEYNRLDNLNIIAIYTTLFPHLTPEQRNATFHVFLKSFNSVYEDMKKECIISYSRIFFHLNETESAQIFAAFLPRLKDKNSNIRDEAINTAKILFPHFSHEQQQEINKLLNPAASVENENVDPKSPKTLLAERNRLFAPINENEKNSKVEVQGLKVLSQF